MGREIRRVTPGWEHPFVNEDTLGELDRSWIGQSRPLYDESYREAASKWWEFATEWMMGSYPDFVAKHPEFYPPPSFPWEYDPPPVRESYREQEWAAEEATAFQIYETVSEGTPVSPVFASEDELVAWVVSEWGHSEEAARKFVEMGSVPSMMIVGGKGMAMNVGMLEPEFRG